jgi:hypothetical protein
MYIRGDHLILLRDLGDGYLLASCEGVVGWVEEECVKLEQGLDLKGVADHRVIGSRAVDGQVQASTGRASPSPSPSPPSSPVQSIPKTVVVSPSPPGKIASLPLLLPEVRITDVQQDSSPTDNHNGDNESRNQLVSHANRSGYLAQSSDSPSGSTAFAKRISSPFELDSPLPSPTPTPTRDQVNPFDSHTHSQTASISETDGRERTELGSQQSVGHDRDTGDSPDEVYRPSPLDVDMEHTRDHDFARKSPSTHTAVGDVENRNRESVLSTTSSEALGGIGGFMMGGEEVGGDDLESTEELTGELKFQS